MLFLFLERLSIVDCVDPCQCLCVLMFLFYVCSEARFLQDKSSLLLQSLVFFSQKDQIEIAPEPFLAGMRRVFVNISHRAI